MTKARRRTRREKVEAREAPTPKYLRKIELLPQTDRQRTYIEALQEHELVFATGCAGTGKTYIAMTHAARLYNDRQIERIVLTRPNVAAGGRGLGFFPGDLNEKMAPWVAPAIDVLKQHLGEQKVNAMLRCGEIVVEPFETMRGKSFNRAFVVLDEAQNATPDQIKMFLTRLGEDSRAVVDGDTDQTDMRGTGSGLAVVLDMIRKQDLPFPVVNFITDDIVRSGVCKAWVLAFAEAGI